MERCPPAQLHSNWRGGIDIKRHFCLMSVKGFFLFCFFYVKTQRCDEWASGVQDWLPLLVGEKNFSNISLPRKSITISICVKRDQLHSDRHSAGQLYQLKFRLFPVKNLQSLPGGSSRKQKKSGTPGGQRRFTWEDPDGFL